MSAAVHILQVGVTYGAPHLTRLEDLLPPQRDVMPMDDERDYSFHVVVDSDLPGRDMKPREPECTDPIDKASHRAQLGYAACLAGGAFESASKRQHSTAVDTAAAEMMAASVSGAVLVHLVGVLCFVTYGVLGMQRVRVWCDNEAAVMAGNDATSIKRLAYIARRVRFLQELVDRGICSLLDVPGEANPADALTKHITPKQLFYDYMARLYNTGVDSFKAQPGRLDRMHANR